MLAPLYNVEQKLEELSNPSRLYVPSRPFAVPQWDDDDEGEIEGTFVSPLQTPSQANLTDTQKLILKKLREGATMSQVILEIYGVRSGATYTQRTREIMELLSRYISVEKVGEL